MAIKKYTLFLPSSSTSTNCAKDIARQAQKRHMDSQSSTVVSLTIETTHNGLNIFLKKWLNVLWYAYTIKYATIQYCCNIIFNDLK